MKSTKLDVHILSKLYWRFHWDHRFSNWHRSIEYLDRIEELDDSTDYEKLPNVEFHTPENLSYCRAKYLSSTLTIKIRRRFRFFNKSRARIRPSWLFWIAFPDPVKWKAKSMITIHGTDEERHRIRFYESAWIPTSYRRFTRESLTKEFWRRKIF